LKIELLRRPAAAPLVSVANPVEVLR